MKVVTNISVLLVLLVSTVYAQKATDYLILQDIGDYKFKTQVKDFITGQTKTIPGYSTRTAPGILAGADHFDIDHDDKTFEMDYINRGSHLSVDVQVTKHAGSDSDKWLLHEVERAFQKPEALGSTYAGKNPIRDINGNRIFYMWRLYRWISNNVVVSIEASDPQGLKPEPNEVVQAYLQKYPSTIPSTLVLDDAHKVKWIKDEVDRRLWLCDKWFMQLQLKKADEKQVYQESVKSMNIFLDYRERYYGLKAAEDKNLLAGYLNSNNGTGIKAKLVEYKNWWAVHKGDVIGIQ
jgi:hypothetical protein